MKRPQATIPVPYENVASLYRTAVATKELVESLAGQTGGTADIAVTWQDLLNLGLIKPEQVPKGLGSDRF